MRTENIANPCCPRCAHTLRLNGHTKKGKTRFRCSYCGYCETPNSTAHNRNVRTWFGAISQTRLSESKAYVRSSLDNVSARLGERASNLSAECSSSESQNENKNNFPLSSL